MMRCVRRPSSVKTSTTLPFRVEVAGSSSTVSPSAIAGNILRPSARKRTAIPSLRRERVMARKSLESRRTSERTVRLQEGDHSCIGHETQNEDWDFGNDGLHESERET